MQNKYEFDSVKFGKRLKDKIKKAGYTQEQFAEEIGTSVTTITSYFSGTMPKAENLLNMARGLNTTVENLLDDEDKTKVITENITPKDIISAINVLIEAYGYDCIIKINDEEMTMDYFSGCPTTEKVEYNAICIKQDKKIQYYLENLKQKGHLRYELSSVGEKDAYIKLLKKWADIDGCIFKDGFIYNPAYEAVGKDDFGNNYVYTTVELPLD